MKKTLQEINKHIRKHQYKYLGLAIFCKLMLIGVLSIPLLQTLQQIYAQTVYTITASAGTGGTITPSGAITVPEGSSQSFSIQANSNQYGISEILVDDIPQTLTNNYTFKDIIDNHTIAASFGEVPQPITTTITCPQYEIQIIRKTIPTTILTVTFDTILNSTSPMTNRTIKGSPTIFMDKPPQEIIRFDLGLISNGNYKLIIAKNTFLNEKLTTQDIAIPFTVNCRGETTKTHTVETKIEAGAGTTDPTGIITVNEKDSLTINLLPEPGYSVDYATIEGATTTTVIGATATTTTIIGATAITLNNITTDYTVHVFFKQTPTPTPSGGGGSTTYVSSTGAVLCETDQQILMNPVPCLHLQQYVDQMINLVDAAALVQRNLFIRDQQTKETSEKINNKENPLVETVQRAATQAIQITNTTKEAIQKYLQIRNIKKKIK